MPHLKQKFYSPPPKNKLIIEKRIVYGKMRKVETYNGKVARVYDEEGKLLEDRSHKLKITLPTPPLEPKVEKKLDISSEEYKPQETLSQPLAPLDITSSTISNLGTSGTIGLQLVPDDEVVKREDIDSSYTDASQCPECKGKNIDTLLYLENMTRHKCRDCNETFVVNKDKKKVEIPQKTESKTIEEISGTAPEISQKLDKLINIQDISNKVDIPKIEPPKETPETPETTNKTVVPNEIPNKVDIPIPMEIQEIGTQGIHYTKTGERIEKFVENKILNIQTVTADNKPKIDIPKIVDKVIEDTITTAKAVKVEQQKKPIEDKKIIKENKNMAEELMEEYKREQWAKKRDFEKNIEDMARVAAENKGQISGISSKIENVEGKLGDVDNKIGNLQENFQEKFGGLQENLQEKLGNIKKPVSDALGELCMGVDCIKNDLKKTQEYQQTYQQTLDKQLEKRFQELGERLQKLEEPTYVCDNCGQDDIRPLSSFCPNCGAPIHSWNDPETGMQVAGWAPYWKRVRGIAE